MMQTDADFIQRLLEGDSKAEKLFFSYYSTLVQGKALSRGLSWEDAEEVSQETLIRVLQSVGEKGGLNEPEKLGAYVHATAKNVIVQFFRDRQKHSQPVGLQQRPDIEPSPPDCSPERQLWKGEFEQQCDKVLSALRPRYRDFLSDYYLKDMDRKTLCRKWQITSGNFRVLHHRALKAFASKAEGLGLLRELLEMMQRRPD